MIYHFIQCPNPKCLNTLSVPSKLTSGTTLLCIECGFRRIYIDKKTYKENKLIIRKNFIKKEIVVLKQK